jgi:hypothetical protein
MNIVGGIFSKAMNIVDNLSKYCSLRTINIE